MQALCSNSKTYKSIDLTTNCRKRQEGKPCSYCYVEAARKGGFRSKTVIDKIEYNNEILRLRQDTIDKLNDMGGLRLFSFGDYMEWMDEDLMKIVNDAKAMGLKLKAITKVPDFVHKFHDHIDLIHISIDNIGEGVDIDVAKDLKTRYDNVRIRAAIMKEEDIAALSWVDILTLNHARNGYHVFTPTEKAAIHDKYPDKLCCATNKCETCKVKCGS